MKRQGITIIAGALVLAASLLGPTHVAAQVTMADYTATPPFASDTSVPPNVLLVLDNSGSMNLAAYQNAFDPNTTYFGLYDPLECYDYGSNKFIPDPAANPATPGTCPTAPYLWSGNLLNYGTMRRIDIVKWVMMGGTCSVGGRDAMGGCRQLIGQSTFDNGAFGRDVTVSVPVVLTADRMPSTYTAGISGLGGRVYFHLMGSINPLKGSVCIDNDGTQPAGSDCDDGDVYGETNWQIRVDHFENSEGVMQLVLDKARFGLMEFKDDAEGGKVLSEVGSNIQDMITGIEATTPATWTPLAESLYEATRYIAQIPPAYANSDYPDNVSTKDPYWFKAPKWASTAQMVPCCKTFIILFTDGEPTEDQNIPAALQDYAHPVHGNHCTGAGCSGHRTDYPNNGSHYLDDVAYWGHINDLRQATIPVLGEAGKDLPGDQDVTLYTFFAFGSGSELLQSAAKAGGFIDKNGNNLPDVQEEWDRVDNLTGAAVPDGVADTYFESDDAFQLKARLLAAITSILQRSTSGSSVSVLASSSTGEGALYQSFFFPTTFEGVRNVSWTGHTAGLFLDVFGNLREDTNGDQKMIYQDDHIIVSRFDVVNNEVIVDRFVDSDEDGKADSSTPVSSVGMKQVKAIWEAGNRLAQTASCNRNVLTWADLNNNGLVDAGEQMPFESQCGPKGQDNTTTLSPYLRADTTPGAVFSPENIINFTRGDQVAAMRDRQLTVGGSLKVWKLGDSIYAQPIIVGAPGQRYDVIYGDSSYTAFFSQYRSRRQVAYVGANDGMLHAFNAGYFHRGDDPSTPEREHGWFTRTPTDNSSGPLLGDELWGFIPQELLPHLRWLADPNYTHVYYVDLTPKVTDVRIFTPDADHPNGWGTILMGGFRLGGSCGTCASGTGAPPMQVIADFNGDGDTADAGDDRTFYSAYFVLDITNPEKDPKLLWTFSSSDLGLTTTVPSMLRVHPTSNTNVTDNTDAKWYMVVGSGPTGYDAEVAQSGKLYAIDLAQGPGANNGLVKTLPAETLDAFMGNTLTIDRDFDYRVDVTYMGSVIDDGNLPWRGKLYRLTTACSGPPCTTSTWGIPFGLGQRAPTEILDSFPTGGGQELGPIAATPAVTLDDSNLLWVFAGTGRYFSQVDKTNTDQQYFVGVKDPVMNASCTETTKTNCHSNDLVDVSNAQVCLLGTGTCGSGTDQVTGVGGVTDFPSLIGLVASKDGWYTTLPNSGERSLSRPFVFSGIVFFPTFAPTADVCTVIGESRLYGLYYRTGSAYSTPVVGTSGASTKTVNRSLSLGQGLATEAVVHVGKGGQHGKFGIFSQNSMGQVFGTDATGTGAVTSRFLSWYSQRS